MLLARMLRRQISLLVLSDARAICSNRERRVTRNTTVTAHIRSLRRKLGIGAKSLIRTISGTGHKIDLAGPDTAGDQPGSQRTTCPSA
jgi:DNA-binding response OmpR family regulator